MDTGYWRLFWTTGMPEAWLMSRGEERPEPARAQPEGGEKADGQAGRPEAVPGGLVGFR